MMTCEACNSVDDGMMAMMLADHNLKLDAAKVDLHAGARARAGSQRAHTGSAYNAGARLMNAGSAQQACHLRSGQHRAESRVEPREPRVSVQ